MNESSVLIIGAGAAGLMAANILGRSGAKVSLIEARNRVGGRILTEQAAPDLPVELGAEFIHGDENVTWELIRAAGLPTHEVPDSHRKRESNGKLQPEPRFWQRLEEVTSRFENIKEDVDFASFLQKLENVDPATRALVWDYVEGFHAADPACVSVQSLARSNQAAEQDGGTRQFRVSSGYSALMDWLRRQLPSDKVTVHLNSEAKSIRWQRDAVQVEVNGMNGPETLEARFALITLPPVLLSSGQVRFEPELPEKIAAAGKIKMGTVAKLTLIFEKQFWPEANFGFIHWPTLSGETRRSEQRPPFPVWWSDERGPVLTGWVGGPAAAALLDRGTDSVAKEGVRCVSQLFGVPETEASSLLRSWHAHDWRRDPFSRGAYSYLPAGGTSLPSQLAAPVGGTLFFAGEATVGDGRNGTVHGALASGRRAAAEIIKVFESSLLTSA